MKTKLFVLAFLLAFGFNAGAKIKKASTFGWNATDATACILSAINSDADTIIIDKQSSDWIAGPLRFNDLSDKTIIFEPGVVLMALKGAFDDQYSSFFTLIRASNITIIGYGATIKMNKAEYQALPDRAEGGFRHPLSINNSVNIRVFGLKLMDSGGDGVFVSGDTWYATPEKPNLYAENVFLKDLWCDNNCRQGISVISAQHLLVQNCRFTNTKGAWPMSGVDIEPDIPAHRMIDVVFEKCSFTDNEKNAMIVAFTRLDSTSLPVDVTFRDCYASGSRGDFEIYAIDWENSTSKGNVKFERCVVENTIKTAVLIRKKATNYFVTFDNCAFVNVSTSGSTNPFKVEITDYAISGIRYGGVAFNNCLLTYSPKIPYLKARGSILKSPGMGNVQINNLTVINPDTTVTYNTTFVGGNVDSDCVFNDKNYETAPATSLALTASNSGLSDCSVTSSVLTATRSADNLSFPIPATYALTGTANQGTDFSRMAGSIVIPKNATSFSDTVNTLKDNQVESTETIDIALKASSLFTSGSSNQVLSIYDCAGFGADTIITFEDRPKTETALTGRYANFNWGVSGWTTYSEAKYSPPTNVLKLNSNAVTPQTGTMVILLGKALKNLKIAVLGNPTVKEVIFSSAGNPDVTITDITSAFTIYKTNWTVASDTVFIKVTCDLGASAIIFDDVSLGDILAPSAPVGLVSSAITFTSATLSWNASSDNTGVKSYEVYKDGFFINSTESTSLNIKGLTCNTKYALTVKAVDLAGNKSTASNSLLVTTAACDVIAPGKPSGLNSSGITTTSFTLSWSGSADNDAVAGYDVYTDGVKYGTANSVISENMALNPGFEKGFTDWGNWSDKSFWAKDTTANFYSGAKCMRMLSPPSGGAGFGQLKSIADFSEGDILEATCHARWDAGVYKGDVYGGCVLGIQVVYGTVKENYEVLITGKKGDNGYNADSLYTVTTPPLKAGFTQIYVFGYRWLQLPGKIVYYDDFTLIKKTNRLDITGLKPSTAYSMTIKAVDVSGNISEPSDALVVTTGVCSLPSDWKVAEIGATGQYSCESNGVFTIVGSGADIWNKADEFIFTYKSIDGDGTIIAKVESMDNPHDWAKSGVMIRETLDVNSKFVDCVITPTNGASIQGRLTTGGSCFYTPASGIAVPYWVKIERIGNMISAYTSPDGILWKQVGETTTVEMLAKAYFGLAVTSHLSGAYCTSVISNVTTKGIITGLSETEAGGLNSDITVYPNPASAIFTVSNIPINAEISVFTITGKLEKKYKSVNKNVLTIDAANWIKGIYLIRVQTESKVFNKKVIVE